MAESQTPKKEMGEMPRSSLDNVRKYVNINPVILSYIIIYKKLFIHYINNRKIFFRINMKRQATILKWFTRFQKN